VHPDRPEIMHNAFHVTIPFQEALTGRGAASTLRRNVEPRKASQT
jgi:hypothetical protein